MAVEIILSRFGWTMEEGLLAEWTKRYESKAQPKK